MNGLVRIVPVWALAAGVAGALLAAGCATTPQAVKAAEPESPAETAIAQAKADAGAAPDASPADPPAPAVPASPADPPAVPPPAEPGTPAAAAANPAPPTKPSSTIDPAATDDTRRGTWIVIEPGGEDPEDVDIVAAARAERERRAKAPPASRTITNKNLVKDDGKPSVKAAKPPAEKTAAPADGAAPPPRDAAAAEAYWRKRSYELRLAWKEAVDEIDDLERDADGLRRRFYAESDPYVRDTRVKPDWDRVLDRIREMRDLAERRRQALADHLEAGHRAGAMPGWLREGIELEPAPRAVEESSRPHEAVEPPEYPEPIGEPPPRPEGAPR